MLSGNENGAHAGCKPGHNAFPKEAASLRIAFKTNIRIGSALLLVWSVVIISACTAPGFWRASSPPQSTPVLTGGAIVVSRPDVYTGGRLVNQRQRDIELLEEKLKAYESRRFQGLRDVRIIRIESGQTGDSEYAEKLAALEREIAALKQPQQTAHGITAYEAEGEPESAPPPETAKPDGSSSDLSKASQGEIPFSSPETGEPDGSSSDPVPDQTGRTESQKTGPVIKIDLGSSFSNDIVETRAELASIEEVRDEMTYRDMIAAELKSKERDEKIMSMGFVEYGLRFEVTVIPGMHTQTMGEAALRMNWEESITPELFRRWRFHLQKDLEAVAFGLQRRWAAGSLTDTEKNRSAGGCVDAAPEHPEVIRCG
jgi:hypothetical protein